MSVLLEGYYRFLKFLLTLLMTLLIIPVSMQILSRYTGLIPRYIWTEEIARFSFVWIIMIGAMIAVRDRTHFDMDVLPKSSSKYVEFASRMFVHLVIVCMALSFIYWGYDFGILGSRQRSEISGLPMLTIYIAWPSAGASWMVFALENMWEDFHQLKEKDEQDGAR